MPATYAPSGETLRAQRAAADLTQQQLAALAGCSVSYIGMLEAGMTPRGATPVLERIGAALSAAQNDSRPPARASAVNDSALERPTHGQV